MEMISLLPDIPCTLLLYLSPKIFMNIAIFYMQKSSENIVQAVLPIKYLFTMAPYEISTGRTEYRFIKSLSGNWLM